VPPTSRIARPRFAIAIAAARAASAQRPADIGSSGATRSMPWCGISARSAADALAVPMSMPR
jgi:hypothetical protein